MGLFRPYSDDRSKQTAEPSHVATDADAAGHHGKGIPTPSRKQAEAARREQLRPTLSKKEKRERERRLNAERNERAYQRIESARERVLLRNFIDSRWTVSEFAWPVLLLSMALFIAGSWVPMLLTAAVVVMWGILAIDLIEITILWFRFRRILDERLPGTPRRGLLSYMASRMISPRRMRRPPTALNRGDTY